MARRLSADFSVTNGLIRQRTRRSKCVTVSILGLAIFFILLAYVAFGDGNVENNSSIKLSFVIFRHGDRNPTETYVKDPFNDLKHWPGGWGALTNKGKLQMYNLGVFLRMRYKKLIGEEYSPNDILIRSSNHDRCLMSAGALLAGMYPPSSNEIWLPGLNWQPIPVHATPRSLDKLIVVKKPCPQYEMDLRNTYLSEEIRRVDADNAALYQYVSLHSGQNVSSVLDVEFLFNTLEIEENNGMKLPEWTSSVYPNKMKRIAEISLAVFTHTHRMKRLVGGPLINDIRDQMKFKKVNKLKPDRSVFLISAHDVTVVNILKSLDVNDSLKPDVGASILFELHSGPGGFGPNDNYVKIFYMNSSTSTPLQMTIPGCTEICSLNKFLSLTSNVAITPEQWENECALTEGISPL